MPKRIIVAVAFLAVFLLGCLVSVVGRHLSASPKNRISLYAVMPNGEVTHDRLFVLDARQQSDGTYALDLSQPAFILDGIEFDEFTIRPTKTNIALSCRTLEGATRFGGNLQDFVLTDSADISFSGSLVRIPPKSDSWGLPYGDQLYITGHFDPSAGGMSTFRWKLLSYLEE